MTMKKNLYIYILLGCSAACFTKAEIDVPSAHDLQRKLHDAHHAKLCIVKGADTKGHFENITKCHTQIKAIETHGATTLPKTLNPNDCTTAKCQIMRLVNQISFNVQALMKLIDPADLAQIQRLNEKIHDLRILLKKYNIEDTTYKENIIGLYL